MTCPIYVMKKMKTGSDTTEYFYRKVIIHANSVEEDNQKSLKEIKSYVTTQNQYTGEKEWKLIDLLTIKKMITVKGAIYKDEAVTTLASNITTTSETSITLTNASLITSKLGGGPTTSEPCYIQIGDEMMKVTNITSNTLTVVRGWYGTAASTHTSGDNIDIPAYNWKRILLNILNDGGSFYLYYGSSPDLDSNPESPTLATSTVEIKKVNYDKVNIKESSEDNIIPTFYEVTVSFEEGGNITG